MEKVITDYKIDSKETLYEGFVTLEKLNIKHGDKEFNREVLSTTNSIAAIVYDTQKKKYE